MNILMQQRNRPTLKDHYERLQLKDKTCADCANNLANISRELFGLFFVGRMWKIFHQYFTFIVVEVTVTEQDDHTITGNIM